MERKEKPEHTWRVRGAKRGNVVILRVRASTHDEAIRSVGRRMDRVDFCTGLNQYGSEAMTRLDKTNRENRIASFAVGAIANGLTEIGGIRVTNVRFTDKGFNVDLEDGSTVACRITAHAPEVAQ